jgi:DNA-binding IclR family transcriptional regulator
VKKRAKPSSVDVDKDSAQVSSALVRGLEILRSFTPNDISLGNQELIDRTGLPKATISRLTLTLVNLGYLNYDDNLGRYSIGPANYLAGLFGTKLERCRLYGHAIDAKACRKNGRCRGHGPA